MVVCAGVGGREGAGGGGGLQIVGGEASGGGGGRGGQLAFVGECSSTKSLHEKPFVSFSVLLTNGATFIKGLCHCALIVLK